MFSIKVPFVIASHVKKFASTTGLINKQKAGAIGVVSGVLYFNNGVNVVPVNGPGGFIPSDGATRVLTPANSGTINAFDSAAGVSYTLPAPVVGLTYDFVVTVLQTSGANVIITNAGTVFVTGSIVMFSGENVTPSATLGPKQFAGNGTTHIKVTTNATTSGGGIGTWLRATCISTTQWYITGVVNSPSGTIVTPFST